MIFRKYFSLVLAITLSSIAISQEVYSSKINRRIFLSIVANPGILPDSVSLRITYHPDTLNPIPEAEILTRISTNLNWCIYSDRPISINFDGLKFLPKVNLLILEPGDSVFLRYDQNNISFSGKGSEKLNLCLKTANIIQDAEKAIGGSFLVTRSTSDYLEYISKLNRTACTLDSLIEISKSRISNYVYRFIKSCYLSRFDYYQNFKFYNLYHKLLNEGANSGVSEKNLCDIFDSTFSNKSLTWMRSQPFWFVSENAYYGFVRTKVLRELNFPDNFSFEDNLERIITAGRLQYKGLAQEYYLINALTKLLIKEYGFVPVTEFILSNYYSEPHIASYKSYVKEFESKGRELRPGKRAPYFSFKLNDGSEITSKNFIGKVTLMNIYFPDNEVYKKWDTIFKSKFGRYNDDTLFKVLNIEIGTRKAKIDEAANQGTGNSIDIYLSKKSEAHSPFLKSYKIKENCQIYLVNADGNIFLNQDTHDGHNIDTIINFIDKQLTIANKQKWVAANDGPYVVKTSDSIKALYVRNNRVFAKQLNGNDANIIEVYPDYNDTPFEVKLKKQLNNEPVIYSIPEKLLALSDIEGNFDAFRKLLVSNKVIDSEYNWIFGKGHLVLAGDMFDRGDQVIECLWLIYSLEEKARVAGGYVHFVLGNHEIMNLSGNIRYVQLKYINNSKLFKHDYSKDLFGVNSELGKWLRTKNIIEKIGDLLFVHAGISKEVCNLPLSLEEMNELARPFYDNDSLARKSTNKALALLFNTRLSPFWYRSYYLEDSLRIGVGPNKLDTTYKTSVGVIDSILAKYDVTRIITGHTIYKGDNNYGKYISVHYSGKVINLDTRHANGYSEGLYVEERKYFRVDLNGRRLPIDSDRYVRQ